MWGWFDFVWQCRLIGAARFENLGMFITLVMLLVQRTGAHSLANYVRYQKNSVVLPLGPVGLFCCSVSFWIYSVPLSLALHWLFLVDLSLRNQFGFGDCDNCDEMILGCGNPFMLFHCSSPLSFSLSSFYVCHFVVLVSATKYYVIPSRCNNLSMRIRGWWWSILICIHGDECSWLQYSKLCASSWWQNEKADVTEF